MDNYINKNKFLDSLIHCEGLGRKSLEALIKHLNNYPTDINMDKIKEQIYEKGVCSGSDVYGFIRIKDLMEILDKGGI